MADAKPSHKTTSWIVVALIVVAVVVLAFALVLQSISLAILGGVVGVVGLVMGWATDIMEDVH